MISKLESIDILHIMCLSTIKKQIPREHFQFGIFGALSVISDQYMDMIDVKY